MTTATRDTIQALPRAELHVHLDGSLRAETMLELAREGGVSLPAEDPDQLALAMRASHATDLVDYLRRFEWTLSVMQSAPALHRITRELVEDHAAEGVRYVEVRYCPALNTQGDLSLVEAVEAPLQGLSAGMAATGIQGRIILCGLRNTDPSLSLRIAQVAVDFKDEGVVGFDLAGPEAGYPAHHHLEAIELARENGLGVTLHAGEAWGPESIRDAVERCGAQRIGHGTRLHEDRELEEIFRTAGIPLEVCLTSNVQTRAVPSLAQHPAGRYVALGIPITLCTDNRLISGTTSVDEYWQAHQHLGLGWDELVRMAREGFRAAFLPESEKSSLLSAFEAEVRVLNLPSP